MSGFVSTQHGGQGHQVRGLAPWAPESHRSQLGDHRYCYPLTITDFASRYLLTCEALSTTPEKFAFTVFERTLKERPTGEWRAQGAALPTVTFRGVVHLIDSGAPG